MTLAMLPNLVLLQLETPRPLNLALESFVAGLLVALALLVVLSYRPLRDRALGLAGLFGLVAAGAWIAFSGIAAALLPAACTPWIRPLSLALGALCLALWPLIASQLLSASPGARALDPIQRVVGLCSLLATAMALVPWPPSRHLAEILLGLIAPLMAGLTLSAGFRARRDMVGIASALGAATVALLVCCATLWAVALGWLGSEAGIATVEVALVALTALLGWSMLHRMAELNLTTQQARAAQLAAAERQAEELEALVENRNLELSTRLRDLNEARQTAEQANLGLQRAMDQLEQAASTDRLTGAWNRRRFEEAVLPEIALAHRRREPLSLLMFDLDHFKRVNDTYGHGMGDLVLVGTVQCIREQLRASDALVRWGGEEFLVMAPATRLEGAMGLAEKLRAALAARVFPGAGHVTMSLGVAEYMLGEGLREWIDRADQALYQAKAGGRNQVQAAPAADPSEGSATLSRSLFEVVWESAYESGNIIIDTQHKKLFRLASALMSVITEDRPLADVALSLETLLAHTAQHFHDEEALLREAHYHDLPHHAAIHASLLTKARQLQADVEANRLDFGKLATFLALDLVKGHILTEDQSYFAHVPSTAGLDEIPPAGA
jgi:diguanylate cyclase (GGDEF)-like protein/hemerythrin-like metal-binding protein